MQISSENYINVLVGQVNTLTIENAQLRAYILDLEAKAKEAENDAKNDENSSATEN